MEMNNRHHALVLLTAASLLLTGCAAGAGGNGGGHDGGHAAHDASSKSLTPAGSTTADGPTEASKMICGDQVMGNVVSILGLAEEPHTVNDWANSTFSCTYHLDQGDLDITVQEAKDEAAALEYFDAMQALAKDAEPIKGLANLGFPAYETADGSAVFQKDRMILQVNASDLPNDLGPEKITKNAFAYQLSTTILGCWIEHP